MKKSTKSAMYVTLAVFVALVLLVGAFYALYKPKEKFAEEAKPKIMLFYATWCKHCENFLKSGKWEEYVHDHPDVEFSTHDYDKESKLCDKYNVNSFPTIVAEHEGKVYKFEGDRTNTEHMKKFVEAVKAKKELTPQDY